MPTKTLNKVKVYPTFTHASVRSNINSGSNLSNTLGTIAKWYDDFDNVCWSGVASTIRDIGSSFVGSSDAGDNTGWYAAITDSLAGSNDQVLTVLLQSGYGDQECGIIHVHIRCNNTTTLYVQTLKWMTRYGFNEGDVIVASTNNVWTLYVYRRIPRYGRIGVTILAQQSSSEYYHATLVTSNTPETTTPTGTVSTGGNSLSPSLLYSGSGSGTVTINSASNNFEYLLIQISDSTGVHYVEAKCPATASATALTTAAIGMSPQYGSSNNNAKVSSCCIAVTNTTVTATMSAYVIKGTTTYGYDTVTQTACSIQKIYGCSMLL